MHTAPSVLALALRRDVVFRALRVAAVVGSILVAINHGSDLLAGHYETERLLRIALTYCVPYLVTTFASVQAIRGERRGP